jgi:U4/U6 small nuclear ribonucleoprotein PRP4
MTGRQPKLEDADDEEMRDVDDGKIALNQVPMKYSGTSGERSRQVVEAHELARIGNAIAIPTDDNEVRSKLRLMGEPITYFGEDKADRRNRLRRLLAEMQRRGEDISGIIGDGDVDMEEDEDEEDEEYYTPGGEALLEARRLIAEDSIARAKQRLKVQAERAEVPLTKHVKHRREVNEHVKKFATLGAQSGFERPVSAVKFSPDSQMCAVGDWAGELKLMSLPNLETVHTWRAGHEAKIGGVAWLPQAYTTQSPSTANLVTGGQEGNVQLWNLQQETPFATLKGHENRVCRLDFHPLGRHVGSASFDYTWRLWDVETQTELYAQEGHSKEVFAFKFHPDGSLAASGGLDAVGRVWDLRTGKTAMILDGHIREIYSLDFAPNGYQIATASADNSVMVWDLRQMKSTFTIPAHTKMVSDVKFYQGKGENNGTFLATSSYDRTIKLWSSDNWVLQKTLQEAEKVLAIDITTDMNYIAAARWDRYIELLTPEDY